MNDETNARLREKGGSARARAYPRFVLTLRGFTTFSREARARITWLVASMAACSAVWSCGVRGRHGETMQSAPTQTAQTAPAETDSRAHREGFITFESPGEPAMRWVMYVPREYRQGTPHPTIVFLNGRGECGDDGWKQVAQGLGRSIMFGRERWNFVVLFPQKPAQHIPWRSYGASVMAGLARARAMLTLDASRTYLTGLSQGGAGTWAIAADNPGVFAAIAPVCGFGDADELASLLTNVPVWAFHGGADDVVHPDQSRRLTGALVRAGNTRVTYTEFAGVNHNSWDPAYNTPELPGWFLTHRLP
jgi:predicted peptidase